jgi:hypothetical protein
MVFRSLLIMLLVTATATAVARGSEPAAARHAVLALVVTNNKSAQLGRPDLRYADDDGAKYYELFRTLGAPEQVALLTDLDADTARLFPALAPIARPPTRANVAESAERLAQEAEALRKQGIAVDFYFIFAGHGDVDRGRGFIELADGAINADDLESLVFRRVPAARLHIILDSCNAFFVINPRKPGGRRFPTPQEAAAALSARLPNAGVFLSTSAEAQVYEWSELQSGIFSHAVRSGLSGAADANGDGRVSYSELAAFVDLASKDVRNPMYRPTVFARGPGGNNNAALIDWSATATPTLELPAGAQRRLTVRDADELPWIDVHTEAAGAIRLHMPARLAEHVAVDVRAIDRSGRVLARRQGAIGAAQSLPLAELSERREGGETRGPSELFRGLFARPFGPTALAAYLVEETQSPAPIGIALEDIGRMRLLLTHTAAIERDRRKAAFATECIIGGIGIGLGSAILADQPSLFGPQLSFGDRLLPLLTAGVLMSGGLYSCLDGLGGTLRRSAGERILDEFETDLARPDADQQRVVARTEQRLFRLYQEERLGRRRNLILGWGWASIGFIGLGLTALHSDVSASTMLLTRVGMGLFTAFGIEVGVRALFETPVEHMVRVWADDPGIQRIPRIGIFAAPGGATVSLSGQF